MSWASEARPVRFEDVVGQEHHCRFLGQLVLRGRVGRNLMFYGPPGSGKTTLAKIYACALNCEAPIPDTGSPCNLCEYCRRFLAELADEYQEINGGLINDAAFYQRLIEREVKPWPARAPEGKKLVIFIDEAHALKREAMHALLGIVEDPPEGVVFLFATSEPDQVIAPLQSRTIKIQVEPLSPVPAFEYLAKFATAKKLRLDRPALHLIIGEKGGYPRDLINGLAHIASLQSTPLTEWRTLTIEDVRRAFGINLTETLLEYLLALADGNAAKQAEIWSHWNEPLQQKVDRIRFFLLHIYYSYVIRVEIVVDPNTAALDQDTQAKIYQRLNQRLVEFDVVPEHFWHKIIHFWSMTPEAADDAALQLRLALFQSIVNDPRGLTPTRGSVEVTTHLRVEEMVPPPLRHESVSGVAQRRRPPPKPSAEPGMSYEQAKRIVETASFMMQRYDRRFTYRLTLLHGGHGAETGRDVGLSVQKFNQALDAALKRWLDADPEALDLEDAALRLTTREYSEDEGFSTHTALWIPESQVVRIQPWASKWLANWNGNKGYSDYGPTTLQVRPMPASAWRRTDSMLGFHWDCVKFLCGTLDPAELDWNMKGKKQSIVSIMKIKSREGRPVTRHEGRSFTTSHPLSLSAKSDAEVHKMELRSAFADGQWDHVFEGWEHDEYQHRRDEAIRRQEAWDRIDIYHRSLGAGSAERRQAALDALAATWPNWPHDYLRLWPAWPERSRRK